MPYTLVKFLLWALLLAVMGGVIGWLLRSLSCRAEMSRLRTVAGDPNELERLRARSAELDEITAERDRLRMEVADVRGSSAGSLGFASMVGPDALATVVSAEKTPTTEIEHDDAPADPSDVPDTNEAEVSAGLATLIPAESGDNDTPEPPSLTTVGSDEAPAAAALDLTAAHTALGRSIQLDDLTVVEGIGPKIAELCTAIGIDTWRSLAGVDVATLQSMLGDAGARFKMHNPDSWPEQAGLLADGRWDDFVACIDRLEGGA